MSGLGWIFACAMLPCFIVAIVGSARWPDANGLVEFGILLAVGIVGMIVGIVTDRGGAW